MKASPRTVSPSPAAVPAPADGVPDFHVGHVPDPDGHAVMGFNHDVGDLLDRGRAGDALHQAGFTRADNVAASRVLIILFQGPHHIVEREPMLGELFRVGLGLELLFEPAPGVDFRDAGHSPQTGPDDPILQRPQLGQAVLGISLVSR